jgi:hypothetical protein
MNRTWKYGLILLGVVASITVLVVCLGALIVFNGNETEFETEDFSEFDAEVPLPLAEAEAESAGNDTTGQATAWVAGAGFVPLVVDWTTRQVLRRVPLREKIKSVVIRFNSFQRKFLMPLHTYLSVLALTLGILHLTLSSCPTNPFPEIGLIVMGILTATGLIFKWKKTPAALKKYFYKFHASLIVSGILSAILITGHLVMD